MAHRTTTNSGTAHHEPITLCQLKSRALPRAPALKSTTFLTCGQLHFRGNHR